MDPLVENPNNLPPEATDTTATDADVAAVPIVATTLTVTNPFANSLHSFLTVKLDCLNFLAWNSQVLLTVIGHGLDDILLTRAAPPRLMADGSINLEHISWVRKDQLLLSWLRSSMSEAILGFLAQYTSLNSAWRALEKRFSNQSKARILQIKSQLSIIQKGNLSIFDYFDKVKILANSLSIAGCPLEENDLVMHLMNDLGPEFDLVVVHVTSRVDALSFETTQSLLLSHESRLEDIVLSVNSPLKCLQT
ncbi:uncharacterized protein LOC133832001 [Humulus lupulus]|uniref:uncharacterized protein LOC133832001 n=1 Tax=Humulus lupulus TaxID=3486 RepID=UPI002B4157D0|nr:uncharacterized protein LOC133832001 [Humulus lupulus]